MLAGPGGDRQPVVLEVEVACVQQKTSQLPLRLDVKVGELDHRHFGAEFSFEFEYERELCEGVSPATGLKLRFEYNLRHFNVHSTHSLTLVGQVNTKGMFKLRRCLDSAWFE